MKETTVQVKIVIAKANTGSNNGFQCQYHTSRESQQCDNGDSRQKRWQDIKDKQTTPSSQEGQSQRQVSLTFQLHKSKVRIGAKESQTCLRPHHAVTISIVVALRWPKNYKSPFLFATLGDYFQFPGHNDMSIDA